MWTDFESCWGSFGGEWGADVKEGMFSKVLL